jgi:hypothetical protein
MTDWTAERIGGLPTEGVKSLRDNAIQRGASHVVELCNAELTKRSAANKKSTRVDPQESKHGKTVLGFHFVCPREKGVTTNTDGTFWTGTWVVDKNHAEQGLKHGAYVALHAAKSDPSYLQGIIRGWRRTKREHEYAEGRPVKIEYGVDFLLEPTNESYRWSGDGSGEKGYVWNK